MRGGERVRTIRRATRSTKRIAIAHHALRKASSEGHGLMVGQGQTLTLAVDMTQAVGENPHTQRFRRGVRQ